MGLNLKANAIRACLRMLIGLLSSHWLVVDWGVDILMMQSPNHWIVSVDYLQSWIPVFTSGDMIVCMWMCIPIGLMTAVVLQLSSGGIAGGQPRAGVVKLFSNG